MAARTIQEQYDDIDLAISRIEDGAQSYTLGDGRKVDYGSLATLYAERSRLRAKLAKQTSGSARIRGKFRGAGW